MRDELDRSFSNQALSDLKAGRSVKKSLVRVFLLFCHSHIAEFEHSDVSDFVRENCEDVSAEDHHASRGGPLLDGFFRGTLKTLGAARMLDLPKRTKGRCFCRDERDIRRAVDIHAEAFGRQLVSGSGEVSAERALELANEHGPMDRELLCDYTVRWWKRNRNTTLFVVTSNGTIVGASTVLPVTLHGYSAMKAGECDCFHVDEEWVTSSSSYILIQGLGETEKAYRAPRRAFSTEALTIFYHMALLCDVDADEPPRFLSFIANKRNEKKLLGHGFEPLGVKMPDTGFELCELSFGKTGRFLTSIRNESILATLRTLKQEIEPVTHEMSAGP